MRLANIYFFLYLSAKLEQVTKHLIKRGFKIPRETKIFTINRSCSGSVTKKGPKLILPLHCSRKLSCVFATTSDLPEKLPTGHLMVHPTLDSTSERRQSTRHCGAVLDIVTSQQGGCRSNSRQTTFYHFTPKTCSDPLLRRVSTLALPSCGHGRVLFGLFTRPLPAGASFQRADR